MKNTFLFILALFLLWTACNDKQNEAEDQGSVTNQINLENENSNFTPFNIPFPQGTKFEIIGSELRFTVPEPYYLAGIDANGNFHKSDSRGTGSVTCECTEGTGCDPIKNGDDIGCLMKNGCSKCTKSSKAKIIGINEELLDLVILHPDNDLMITEFSELDKKYFLPISFLEFPEINDLLSNIHASQQSLPDMPKETVFINVHGYILAIELKIDKDNTSIKSIGPGGGDIICTCNIAGNKCPREKHWSGVVWCNSDKCTNCTMTAKLVDPTGKIKFLSSENGQIKIN